MKKESKVVLIRADGSKAIGMGHLNRACLLVRMLQQRFGLQAKLVARKDDAAAKFLASRNMPLILLPTSMTMAEEIESLLRINREERPVLFILDVLEEDVNPAYMRAVKSFGGSVVAITDDSHRRVVDADIILNGNPHQLKQDYSGEKGRYLLGPMYFLMNPAHGKAKVKEPTGKAKKILLSFGGSDHHNLLFRVLDALEKINQDLSVLIVTSSATGYLERLRKHLQTASIKSELLVDVSSFAPLWGKCDLALTAGGNTLFERIAARLPGGTVCQLKRQMEIADCFTTLGVNFNVGLGVDLSDDVLHKKISILLADRELHRCQYQKACEITDGQGLNRFVKEIKILLKEETHELQRAS